MSRSNVVDLDAPDIRKAERNSAQERSIWACDPRPDITGDTAAWSQLLLIAANALGKDDALFGALHGIRCCGAGLQRAQDGSWRITAGEMASDEYVADREQWLMPRRREVAELLRRLMIAGVI